MTAPTIKQALGYLLKNGAAEHATVKWGRSYRDVIIIGGKKYQYKGGHNINKNLQNKIVSLYISMSESSNQKTKTIKNDAAAKIQKLSVLMILLPRTHPVLYVLHP